MRIKEAAALCGLTEKAIRLYEEKGLIAPRMTEKNGRAFRDYDEDTVSRLQTIAALRRAFFSMEQIAAILDTPENIPTVFASYRAELQQKYAELKPLLGRAEEIDPATLSTAADVSEVMTVPAPHGVSEDVLPTLHFRVWDEEQSRDEREIAYARCQKYIAHWGRFYGAYLVFDTVCEWIGRSFKVITAVLAAMVVLALVLYYVPLPMRAVREMTGYEVTIDEWDDYTVLWNLRDSFQSVEEIEHYDISALPDPTDIVLRIIRLDGWVFRYAFRPDFFVGDVSISGYTSTKLPKSFLRVQTIADMEPHETKFRFYIEDIAGLHIKAVDDTTTYLIRDDKLYCVSLVLTYDNSVDDVMIFPLSGYGHPVENGVVQEDQIAYSWSTGYRHIIAPAETIEEAKRLYYEYEWKPREIRIFETAQKRAETAE